MREAHAGVTCLQKYRRVSGRLANQEPQHTSNASEVAVDTTQGVPPNGFDKFSWPYRRKNACDSASLEGHRRW